MTIKEHLTSPGVLLSLLLVVLLTAAQIAVAAYEHLVVREATNDYVR